MGSMNNKRDIPDAWDDDWVNVADKSVAKAVESAPPKLTKTERRAQHAMQQKQLWDSAENPGRNLWLEAQGVVPSKQDFKPQVTLLSRKPVIAKRDGANGADDGADSEDERRKKQAADLEERQRKAKVEREEKQRRYAEARERIMGSSKPASPSNVSRESSQGRDNRKPRGRNNGSKRSQPESSANPSPSRTSSGETQLFDPNDMGRRPPRTDSNTPKEEQPLRQPRGPETSGRGGFGFGGRGGNSVV